MDIQNKKQAIINKRFEINQEIKKHRNLLKTDKNNELLHLRALNDLKEERQTVNFLINKFNYIKNYF